MKHIKKYNCIWMPMLLLFLFSACEQEEKLFKDIPAPAPVTNVAYTPTHGGAIITYQLPNDKNLLYVKAVYVNGRNEEVFRVCSRYGNTVEIDGLVEEKPHTVRLYSVAIGGEKESKPVEISVTPDKSYIFLTQESITAIPVLGGFKLKWHNPAKKMVHIYVTYGKEGENPVERIFSSEFENDSIRIRELDAELYSITTAVEDHSKNITSVIPLNGVIPLPEQKIKKDTWELIKNMSCMGDKWEGRMVNFWDDVIDINTNPGDNSYFIIHREDNGGALRFLSDTEPNPLMIVIDMHKKAIVSRLIVWQRAFKYDSSNSSSTSNSNYLYYQDDNMRAFNVFLTNDLSQATRNNLWNHPTFVCDIGEPLRDEEGNILQSENVRAEKEGHEFELPDMSEPFRYIVIGIVASYGSETQICSSEFTLYGMDNVE